ncbi:unnamed protein product [Urochloa decumbens]|uniref:DUF1618 domain-containing protein n=1 Tax=Urochloa decumbens TaxID=240449 RepID=A0ABC9B192_9POAL
MGSANPARGGEEPPEGSCPTGDLNTITACLTTAGCPIRVAPPPAESYVCVQVADRAYASVVVAHGASVLIEVGFDRYPESYDHFVYNAGAAVGDSPRPPMLSLLPRCYRSDGERFLYGEEREGPAQRHLDSDATGLLQRLLPTTSRCRRRGNPTPPSPSATECCAGLTSSAASSSASTCSTRSPCYMAAMLSLSPSFHGVAAVVYVGATFCRSSHDAYTIRTWTLSLNNDDNTDDMAWVMDGMLDATELWDLDAYHGLPRVQLAYPIVSMEEPHVIFFMVCESFYVKKRGDETKWLLLVDMKSKTVRSVYRYDEGMGFFHGRIFIPSSLSGYFNSSPSCGDCASSVSKSNMSSDEPPPLVTVNEHQLKEDSTKLKAASPEETILATLQEIPGLAREDMLKAYSILNHDSNGRRFKSLLGLPMDLRKEWLLMEIKTSESCSVCSACTANSQLG